MSAKKVKIGFFGRLQPRERMLVMALAGVFFIMATFVLIMLRMSRMGSMESEIVELKEATELVYTRGAVYEEKLAEKEKREAKISDKALIFSTLIEKAESTTEISTANQEEKPLFAMSDNLQKRSIEFDLKDVSLTQLTKFLATVEAPGEHVVLTQRIEVRSLSSSEDRLNANLELATWERIETEAEGEAP
jgi:hypothetical protein